MKKHTLLFAILLSTAFCYAQPVQVRIDSTYDYRTSGGNSQETAIDFDNDGDTDFTFQYLKDNVVIIAHIGSYSTNSEVLRSGFNIRSLSENQQVSSSSPGSFDRSNDLNPSNMFESFRLLFAFCNSFSCNTNGNFTEATNRYVGVRFRQDASSEWQYGYIKISASVDNGVNDAFITIHSIGYEQTPGEPIRTGAGIISSSLSAETPETVSVFPNPTAGVLNIDPSLHLVNISVFNGLGQLVINDEGNDNQLDLGLLPKGSYQLVATDREGRTYVQRVVRQ